MKKYSWMKAFQPISPQTVAEKKKADGVIIGAGHAGTCAARAAAEAGVSVIVLEQQPNENQYIHRRSNNLSSALPCCV